MSRIFGITATAFLLNALSQTFALAQQCFPPPYRIAICNFECSGMYCGYELPLVGRRSAGTFITYNSKSDGKPIVIPGGQSQGMDAMRLSIQNDNASLHVYVDEQPDYSLEVVQIQSSNYIPAKIMALKENLRGASSPDDCMSSIDGTTVHSAPAFSAWV
jgi:hypothetical protein